MASAVVLAVCLAALSGVSALAAGSRTITVTTDGNGTVDGPASAVTGEALVWMNITPNSGYVFDQCSATGIAEGEDGETYSLLYSGWPTVSICVNQMPDNDIAFDIAFAEAVTATYDANGGTTGPLWRDSRVIRKGQSEDFGIDDELIAPPEGKEYDGVEVDGVRYGPTDIYTYDADVSVVYQWKDAVPHTDCHVSYDLNGGTPTSDYPPDGRAMLRGAEEEIRFLADFAEPPAGKAFDGVEIEGVRYGSDDTWTVPDAEAVTVKYLWRDAAPKCVLVLDINGGTAADGWSDCVELDVGEVIVIPENIDGMADAPEGKTYAGMNIDGTDYAIGDAYTIPDRDSLTIRLLWKDVSDANESDEAESSAEPAAQPAAAPQTGDRDALFLWCGLMAFSLIALAVVLVVRRGRRHEAHRR